MGGVGGACEGFRNATRPGHREALSELPTYRPDANRIRAQQCLGDNHPAVMANPSYKTRRRHRASATTIEIILLVMNRYRIQ